MEENLQAKNTKASIRKCPYCGEILPPLSKVCPSCGQIVDETDGDITSMMTEIDEVCATYANKSIRFYDYILLLVPLAYLVWVVIVILKIKKSNKLYNDFFVLSNRAKTLYGANSKFTAYINTKTAEVEENKRKNKVSHVIVYTLIIIDVLLLSVSLSN